MRDRRKLEPISIDELANDSTMTGFSDLFKIPTEPKTLATVVPGRWSRAKDIVSKSALLSRIAPKETLPRVSSRDLTKQVETSPPVIDGGASIPAVRQMESITPGGVAINETHQPVLSCDLTKQVETGPPVIDGGASTPAIRQTESITPGGVAINETHQPVLSPSVAVPVETSPPASPGTVPGRYEAGPPVLRPPVIAKHVEEIHPGDTAYPPVTKALTDRSMPLSSFDLHDLRVEITPPVPAPLEITPSGTQPPITGGPVSGWAVPVFPRKLQVREAKLVQEGHTYGEQTVYDALWKNANAVSESVRLITIGFLRMANLVGLAESNCKIAVAGLLDKLAIERLPDLNIAQGRTYKIYAWSAILSRRRAAGLTHVVKSRGVVFVDPKTGIPLTSAKTLPRKKVGTGGRETSPPVSSCDLPAGSYQSTVTELASRLRQNFDPSFDDSAAARLWRDCQSSVPDCTIEEVVHFAALKAQKIYKDRNIRNPIGLLLMTVPEFFTGSALKEFRDQKGREVEQQREFQTKQREYWTLVAQDPNTPLDERQLAAKFLTELFSE
jgi:hypothetical protein